MNHNLTYIVARLFMQHTGLCSDHSKKYLSRGMIFVETNGETKILLGLIYYTNAASRLDCRKC